PGDLGTNHVVLLIRDFGPATAEALGYVRSFRPRELTVLYPSKGPVPPEIQDRWRTLAGSGPDLQPLKTKGDDLLTAMRTFLSGVPREPRDFVTVVIAEDIDEGLTGYLLRKRPLFRLKAGLLRESNVALA